jgi:hypothetical protein
LKHVWNGLYPNDLESVLSIEMTFSAIVGTNMNQTMGFFRKSTNKSSGSPYLAYLIRRSIPDISREPLN